MLAMLLPLALSLHCATRGCDVRLGRRPALLVMTQTDGDDRPQPTDGMSLGDLLAEVATRQQASLPDRGAQRSLADSTLNAMLDTASSELANTFDALTVNLSAVERNVSTTLSSELTSAGTADISRLERVRDDTIQPGRRQVQAEIAALIEAAEERRNASAALSRASESSWGRDDAWWRARLAAGGSYVSALTASAGVLGLLLAAAAVDLALGHPGAEEWRPGLALAWRGGFVVGLAVYMFALGSLTQRPAGQDKGDA